MTTDEKLTALKSIMGIEDTSMDGVLNTYLSLAQNEIISWRYSYASEDSTPTEVPAEYEQVQIFAVIAGYSQSGAENQTSHSENGISRTFKYEDMVAYIHAHVIPFVKVLSVKEDTE